MHTSHHTISIMLFLFLFQTYSAKSEKRTLWVSDNKPPIYCFFRLYYWLVFLVLHIDLYSSLSLRIWSNRTLEETEQILPYKPTNHALTRHSLYRVKNEYFYFTSPSFRARAISVYIESVCLFCVFCVRDCVPFVAFD